MAAVISRAVDPAPDRSAPSVASSAGVVLTGGVAPGVVLAGEVAPGVVSLAGLGPEVAAALAVVVRGGEAGGLSGCAGDGALAVVEAVEAVKAWADSVAIDATAVLVAELESDLSLLGPDQRTARGWRLFFRSCRSAAAREIQVGTGLAITACQRRVWLAACEPERTGAMLAGMRAGRVSLARAMTVAEATAELDGVTAAGIAARVLGPLRGRDEVPLPGAAPVSEATFRARLRTQLVAHHGLVEAAKRTYELALKERRVQVEAQPAGTALLLISGDGARVAAAQGRVDTIARQLRRCGDARTLDQLRADVATDLLMRGWIPNDPTFTKLGDPPTATVQLLVSLSTLLGLDQGVGQITGWGPVPTWQARALALQAGSIWKRLVTDPLTGQGIEVSATTYQVPAAMAEQVNARDRTCRAPGCEIPAGRCDTDHTQEWRPDGAGGPTTPTNLATLHRGHHNLKTAGFWDTQQDPDGTLTWTTALGRTVRTYPYIYDHPDNLPITGSALERHLGTRLAAVINPDIPAFNDVFDQIAWSHTLKPVTPPPAHFTYDGPDHHTTDPHQRPSRWGPTLLTSRAEARQL